MKGRIAVLGILVMLHVGADRAAAQVFTTPKGEAENVKFEQVGGGTVHILYDLVASDPRAVFLVTLDASQDRGASYTVKPLSVSGDVGQGISAGRGKRIVWESGRDVERLEIDQFRFRISAQAGPLELKPDPAATPKPAPSAAAPPSEPAPAPVPPPTPAATAAKPPTAAQTATAKPSGGGGGGKKWLLIGAGVAAAGGVAIAAGGGGGGGGTPTTPPTTTTPPVTANRPPEITGRSHDLQAAGANAIVGVTRVIFQVTATDADANQQLTAVFTFGDGTTSQSIPIGANGTANADKIYTSAGPQRASVAVSDGRGGSTSADYVQLTTMSVSGIYTAPGAANVRLEVNQTGAAVTGTFTDGTRVGSISGQIESPRKIEALTITYRTGATGSEVVTAQWGPDLRSITVLRSGTTLTLTRQQ